MINRVKLLPFDHKSKMRLLEHSGWQAVGDQQNVQFATGQHILVQASDGYMKWWPVTHVGN